MGPRVREDDKNKKRKSRAKFSGKEQKTQYTAATPPTVIPAHAGIHTPTHARSRVGNILTATDNDESETSSNNEALKPSHGARYTMDPRVREDDKNKKRKSRAKFSGKEQKTQHTAATPPTVIPVHTGDPFIHTCQKPRLEMYSPQQTTTKAKPTTTTMKREKRATALAIRWVPAFARMTKTRKEKAELSSAAKNKKLSTPPPRPQLSFPRMRGSIHPHVPEAAFGNALAATDNDESETSSNNKALKPSYSARYTITLRVREDDSVRELIRTTSNTNNKALKPSYSARYTIALRVREDDKNKKRKSRAKFSGKE